MKIGVVIPCINLWEQYTLQALHSLESKQNELYVVVVDNGSTDITQEASKALISPNFVYIRNEKNLGCSAAWNQGTKKCFENSCDYVLIINNDVILHPEAIDRLVNRFNKQQNGEDFRNLAMVTCNNTKGDCRGVPSNIFTLDPKGYETTNIEEYPDFSGFMITKKTYEEIGEFDEGFNPAYFEDNDYHRRLKLAGYIAIKEPSALFYHYGSATRKESGTVTVTDWSFINNRAYFEAKWGGLPENDGQIGTRLYTNPFNDKDKNFRWTMQNRCKQGACRCSVNCDKINHWNNYKINQFSLGAETK